MLQNFLTTIQSLSAFDFAASQRAAIVSNTEVLSDLQTEQFSQGTDKQGKKILLEGQGYAFSTIAYKRLFGRNLGAIVTRVTLFQSGMLYRNTFASINGDSVLFSSNVPYWGELLSRTGDITGLDRERAMEFANGFVLPYVGKQLYQKTGLKITSKVGVAI